MKKQNEKMFHGYLVGGLVTLALIVVPILISGVGVYVLFSGIGYYYFWPIFLFIPIAIFFAKKKPTSTVAIGFLSCCVTVMLFLFLVATELLIHPPAEAD